MADQKIYKDVHVSHGYNIQNNDTKDSKVKLDSINSSKVCEMKIQDFLNYDTDTMLLPDFKQDSSKPNDYTINMENREDIQFYMQDAQSNPINDMNAVYNNVINKHKKFLFRLRINFKNFNQLIFNGSVLFNRKVKKYIGDIQTLRSTNTTFNKIIAIKDKIVRFPSNDNVSVDVEKYKSVMLEQKTITELLTYDKTQIDLLDNEKEFTEFVYLAQQFHRALANYETIQKELNANIYQKYESYLDEILNDQVDDAIITYIKLNNTEKYTQNLTSEKYYQYNKKRFNIALDNSRKHMSIKYTSDNEVYYREDIIHSKIITVPNQNPSTDNQTNYIFGNFSRIFLPTESNKEIAEQMEKIVDGALTGKPVFILGYGSSGAGKTSSLIYLSAKIDDIILADEGILPQLCSTIILKFKNKQNIDISNIDVKTVELYSANNGTETKIEKKDFTFNTKIDGDECDITLHEEKEYNNKHVYMAQHSDEYRTEDKNSQSDYTKMMFKKGDSLGRVIKYLVDTDRLVKATTNNPQSSRSHVLVFVDFIDKDISKKTTIIVGDFAGVENKFDCYSKTVLDNFLNIINNNQNFYLEQNTDPYNPDVVDPIYVEKKNLQSGGNNPNKLKIVIDDLNQKTEILEKKLPVLNSYVINMFTNETTNDNKNKRFTIFSKFNQFIRYCLQKQKTDDLPKIQDAIQKYQNPNNNNTFFEKIKSMQNDINSFYTSIYTQINILVLNDDEKIKPIYDILIDSNPKPEYIYDFKGNITINIAAITDALKNYETTLSKKIKGSAITNEKDRTILDSTSKVPILNTYERTRSIMYDMFEKYNLFTSRNFNDNYNNILDIIDYNIYICENIDAFSDFITKNFIILKTGDEPLRYNLTNTIFRNNSKIKSEILNKISYNKSKNIEIDPFCIIYIICLYLDDRIKGYTDGRESNSTNKHFERKKTSNEKTSIVFTGYNQNPSDKKNEKLYLDNQNPYLDALIELRQEIIKIQYGDEKYYKASQMKNLDKNAYINQIKTIQTKLKDIFISKDTNTLENQRKLKSQESIIIKLFFKLVFNNTEYPSIKDYILNNVTSFDKYNSFYNELVEYNSTPLKYNNLLPEYLNQYINKYTLLQEICINRVNEGKYINHSLEQIRSLIQALVTKKFKYFYNFLDKCFAKYNINFLNTSNNMNFDFDNNKLLIINAIYDHLKNGYNPTMQQVFQPLIICIFGVLNISRLKNNPPETPYINTNHMENLENLENLKNLENIKNDIAKYENHKPFYEDILKQINSNDDDEIAKIENNLRKLNAASSIGTLEFIDSIAKMNMTNIICSIDNTSNTQSQKDQTNMEELELFIQRNVY